MSRVKIGSLFLVIGLAVGLAIGATAYNQGGVESPPGFGFAITPNDNADLPQVTRSIFIGTGGDIKVRYAGNDFDTPLKNQPSGQRLPGRFSRVFSTGTNAQDLVGEY